MDGLIQPPPVQAERDNSRWIIVIALVAIAGIVMRHIVRQKLWPCAALFALREVEGCF